MHQPMPSPNPVKPRAGSARAMEQMSLIYWYNHQQTDAILNLPLTGSAQVMSRQHERYIIPSSLHLQLATPVCDNHYWADSLVLMSVFSTVRRQKSTVHCRTFCMTLYQKTQLLSAKRSKLMSFFSDKLCAQTVEFLCPQTST